MLLPLLYSASEGAATGAGYKTVVTSVITHLASLDCYTPEQLLGRLPPRMFHRNTVRGRLSLRQSDGYGKARKAARCTETLNVRETLPVKECSD
ncbi:hypothetical protein [Bacteroides ovatus]|uniref:hypothetical protein n=1 Tax=Bacteroides ovatus TaxID=28116 RepID=UPI0022E15C6D|nr:hypothetical protein [Bacteroides ovatus]